MLNRPIAITGAGQTTHRRAHADRSTADLVWEASTAAAEQAAIELSELDAFVYGVAPDGLSGLNCPEKSSFLAPAGKPMMRVNTGGLTGASALQLAVTLVASGQMESVIAIALERMGQAVTSQAVFNTIFDPIWEKDIALSTLSMCAIRAQMLMALYGYTSEHWAAVAARNYASACENPYAQVRRPISVDEIKASKLLSWPIRLYEGCPMSEGACAVIVTSQPRRSGRCAWIRGIASLSDTYAMGDRMHRPEGTLVDLVTLRRSAERAYRQAGIDRPAEQLDVVEIHAPFSSAEAMAYAPLRLCEPAGGPAFVEDSLAGRVHVQINPSGGPQAANPVSATGLIRIAEVAAQVMGEAGPVQVDGARHGLATSQGGATQFSMAVIVSSEAP
jgi:acetyl-CoA C-acetyltransferase